MTHPFLAALETRILLADGATGTELHDRGVPASACLDSINLENPDLVQALHEDYIAAGADIIETNTFGANRIKLGRYGLADRVRDVNLRGVAIAREARRSGDREVFVAGAVGPVDVGLPAAGDVTLQQARRAFREQIEALVEAEVDLLMLETFSTLAETREALLAAREVTELPVVAQLTFQRDGRTWSGEEPGEAVRELHALGADVVGVNCVPGPQVALEIVERMAAAAPVKLSAQANAGRPRVSEQGLWYPATPQSFAEYVPALVAAGASIVGGCCGTTPDHIAAMRRALSGETAVEEEALTGVGRPGPLAEVAEAPAPEGETLREKLATGRFVVAVEIDPPRGLNARRALEGAARLKEVGVDCINVGDSPMARVRMSPITMALLIHQRVGLETIVHLTTRDRNLMALQADLIGAHVLGLRNVLCLRGDPPTGIGYARAVEVRDVSPVGLIRVLRGLNEGVDWAGSTMAQPTSFFIGVAANPTAPSLEAEMKLLRRKVGAGADFIMTQAVYDREALDRFLKKASRLKVPILLGVMPLHSLRHAEFIRNELPGVVVPDEVRERLRQAGDNALAEGVAIARELVEAARGRVQGVYLVPSFNRFDVVADLAEWVKGAI
jgi:methionine synthase I (cobalamin-dependent)/5,10-methylenetetrahydrofolate reductase